MTDSLTPFDPNRQHSLAATQDNVPRGMTPGRGSAQGPVDEQGSVPWTRYISAIKRSWWLILLATAVGTGAGVYLASLQPVEYVAQTQVLVNPNMAQPNAPIGTRQLLPSDQWVSLMQSPIVADSVVTDLQLHVHISDGELRGHFSLAEEFRAGTYRLTVDSAGQGFTLVRFGSGEMEAGLVGDSIGRTFGFRWAPPATLLPPARSVDVTVQSVREASQGILARLTPRLTSEDGRFMQLTFRDRHPARAALILNTWTDRFVRAAGDMKGVGLVQARSIVAEQLSMAQTELYRAEAQLRAFGEATAGMPARGADGGASGAVIEQRLQLDDLQRDRSRLESMLQRAGTNPIPPQEFWSVPEALNAAPQLRTALAELEKLQTRRTVEASILGPEHPVRDTLERDIRRLEYELIPRYTRDLVSQYRLREADLQSRVSSQTEQLRAIPARALQEQRLYRQVASFEALHEALTRKAEELRLTEAQTAPDLVRLGVATIPTNPERNDAARLLLMAVVASLGAGIALALLRDRIDRRLRYPEQATMDLGLTIAGTVPHLRFNRKKELGVTALSQVVESFRAMRLTVRHQFPNGEPVVICVSSPGPAEGKSLVSSNLAVAFANAGHSTLLIDGDVRRGVVHSTFDAPRRPGLVDHLGGRATADSVIRPTSTPNLSIIPSGTRTRNAPELLVSDALGSLVAAMRERFEVVIIDSAPFAAGMDAFALGAAAGTMLVVLRPGVTDRRLAAMKLEVLDRLPVAVVGAVLNGIAHGSAYRYYYADYGYADAREWALDDDANDPGAALAGAAVPPARMIDRK